MKRLTPILVSMIVACLVFVNNPTWGRGFGGGHAGGGLGGAGFGGGGFGGGAGLGGAGFGGRGPGGGLGGAGLGGAGLGGPGAGGLGAGGLGAGGLGAGGIGQGGGGLGQGPDASRLGGGGQPFGGLGGSGLGSGGLGGGGLGPGGRDGGLGGLGGGLGNLGGGAAPTRSQLSSFLGLPSDNGLHNLSGETQSKGSQIVDNIRAGDGPEQGFIHGETQKPLSKLYDNIQAGNHPFQPVTPWIAHNNAVVIRNNFNNYNIYTSDWYRRYPGAWYPRAWAYGNAWVYAPWGTLWVWLGLPSAESNYYDYGTNVVVQDGSVYVNGADEGTTTQYYQQAQSLAQAGAGQQASDNQQWMPLGVFAISDGQQTTATNILQLAVNKQGILRGNYTDSTTNKSQVVQGSVDKQTERAAWTIGDDSQTVYETGVYNLTMDQTPVIVHFGNDKTKQLSLVRLDKQDQPEGAQPGDSP